MLDGWKMIKEGFAGRKAWNSVENTGQETGESSKPCDLKLVIAVNRFKSMFAEASEKVYVTERF